MNPRDIDKVVDIATEGLKGDKELRLDVRQELVSHIEEAMDERQVRGMGEDQSLEESLKAFGSPMDIAAELVTANRARMRLRQLLRLAVRALLVPASIAVAMWIYYDTVTVARTAGSFAEMAGASVPLPVHNEGQVLTSKPMDEETEFLVFGDLSLEDNIDRQRSIWEKDPTNKIFYGNYITALIAYHPAEDLKDLEFIEKELRRGEELDPENARYNYLLAAFMAEKASELVYEETEDGEERALRVDDRDLLDRAMREMLTGGRKPFLDNYALEMQALRFDALPEVTSMVEMLGRVGFAASTLLPDVSKQRDLARKASEYSKLLISEGKKSEALPFLQAWYPLAKQSFEQDGTLIEALVSFAIMREGSNCVSQLEMLGEKDLAESLGQKTAAVQAVFDDWRSGIKAEDNGDFDHLVQKHGSILHALLLPALGSEKSLTKEDLAPGRQLEQTMLERGWLSSFTGFLLFLMLALFLVSLVLRFSNGGDSAPILLLPDAGRMLRIVIYSVFVPLAVFFIYTRHTDLAGRDMSLRMWPRFLAELHLLMVAMLSVAAYQIQKYVGARCRELGLEAAGARSYWQLFLFSLIPIGLIVWLASGRKRSALFRGTVARSLIPIVGVVIVLVGTLTHPYLLSLEKKCVQDDGILGMPSEGGFTRIETHVTKRLNKLALEAMTEELE